jgi:hypothetical protein
MSVLFAVFATTAFVLTMVQVGFWLMRWLREPSFHILSAYFQMRRHNGIRSVKGGQVTVVALGGGRTRRVVESQIMVRAEGSRASIGGSPSSEPFIQTIPAHEATKFQIGVPIGNAVEGEPAKLRCELYLHLDRYWKKVDFSLHKVSGDFALDQGVYDLWPWHPVPWWKRIGREISKRLY